MTIKQRRMTTAYVKTQTAKGSAATVGDANAVDLINDFTPMQPKGEQVDRGLVRGSRFPSKQHTVGKWSEGTYPIELRGGGTAGVAPEFGPLLLSLLGTETVTAAGTVNDAAATTTEFDSDLDMTVGQIVGVTISGAVEYRRIASKSGAGPTYTYTVHRAFSGAPVDTAVIVAGVSYHHVGSEVLTYLTIDQYLDGLRLLNVDAVCESLSIGVTEKEIIKGEFALRAITPTESAASDPNSPIYDDTAPLDGTSCNLVIDGTSTNMKSMEMSLGTRRERGGINSTGISELPFMDTFDATLTATPWVEDVAPFSAWFAGSLADIEMAKGTVDGNRLVIIAEDVQYTGAEMGDDEGDFIWNLPAVITGGITIAFF